MLVNAKIIGKQGERNKGKKMSLQSVHLYSFTFLYKPAHPDSLKVVVFLIPCDMMKTSRVACADLEMLSAAHTQH